MKLKTSAYQSDRLTLSWGDLWALVTGRTLRVGALTISLGQSEPQELFSAETLDSLARNQQASNRLKETIKEYERAHTLPNCGIGFYPPPPPPPSPAHPRKCP